MAARVAAGKRKEACAAFMGRCLGFFEGLGVAVERVMTDNGPAYRSRLFNDLLDSRGVGHRYTRPHGACGGLPSMSRIVGVNNVMAHIF